MNDKYVLELKGVSVSYSPKNEAVKNVSVSIRSNAITSIIGSVGCGKSSLLRSINRMHELYPCIKVTGEILLNGKDILTMNPIEVRRRAGMVFQTPNPFLNMSIYQNVLSGYSINKIPLSKIEKEEIVENCLKGVFLWNEVKDDLRKKACSLSAGQQQQLCIARTIALNPELLLMDEPTSSIDFACSNRIEELIHQLKDKHTIIVVPGSLSQASRISDYTMFMEDGELVEFDTTNEIFVNPKDKRTEKYIIGQSE